MGKKWEILTRWGHRLKDWVDLAHQGKGKVHYTDIQVFVPRPQVPSDVPTLWVTISTGPRGRVAFRLRDLAAWDECWQIPADARARLARQLQEARDQSAELTEAERLGYLRSEGLLVRTDTGELVPPKGSLAPAPQAEDYNREFAEFMARPTHAGHDEGV